MRQRSTKKSHNPQANRNFTVPYNVKSNEYRVWMFGDSILDNSYWNGVEKNTTDTWLKKMLPGVEVLDRTTEELTALGLL